MSKITSAVGGRGRERERKREREGTQNESASRNMLQAAINIFYALAPFSVDKDKCFPGGLRLPRSRVIHFFAVPLVLHIAL